MTQQMTEPWPEIVAFREAIREQARAEFAAELATLRALLAEAQDVIEAARDEAIAEQRGEVVEKRRAGEIITEWEDRVRSAVRGIWRVGP